MQVAGSRRGQLSHTQLSSDMGERGNTHIRNTKETQVWQGDTANPDIIPDKKKFICKTSISDMKMHSSLRSIHVIPFSLHMCELSVFIFRLFIFRF